MEDSVKKALETHPCYNEKAHRKYARMHIPIAPKCNIQCNFCNRKYDCTNESRPGVSSQVLSPSEAVSKIRYVKEKIPSLKVIGIAGPGDPLANETTFETLALMKKEFPDLVSCVSTNGLVLPQNAERLYDLGVRFVTVTVNAESPDIGAKIYDHVLLDGKKYTGEEGAGILLERQMEGIKKCADLGMLVKVNIVMVPEINASSIPDIVKAVKSRGAYIVNILPLIPVSGTKFANMRAPTPRERRELMDLCENDARMMRHCKQCRADAIGLLGNDRSAEFAGCGCPATDDPRVATALSNVELDTGKARLVAVASNGGEKVDAGFAFAERFFVYSVDGKGVKLLREVNPKVEDKPVAGKSHREIADGIFDLLDDCDAVAVAGIGEMPMAVAASRGKKVVVTTLPVEEAAKEASGLRIRSAFGIYK